MRGRARHDDHGVNVRRKTAFDIARDVHTKRHLLRARPRIPPNIAGDANGLESHELPNKVRTPSPPAHDTDDRLHRAHVA
jgi:hypothetical protein